MHLKTSVHLEEEELLSIIIHQELDGAYLISAKTCRHLAVVRTS